jgi:hypothetical protein
MYCFKHHKEEKIPLDKTCVIENDLRLFHPLSAMCFQKDCPCKQPLELLKSYESIHYEYESK